MAALKAAGEAPVVIGEVETGRGVKSNAKGKGDAEAVRFSGRLAGEQCAASPTGAAFALSSEPTPAHV